MSIEKMGTYYRVDGNFVSQYDKLWAHTMMRIENAEVSAREKAKKHMANPKWRKKNGETNYDQEFLKLMVQRLQKITNMDKVYYAVAVLNEKGYSDVVDVYEDRILMDKMLEMHETAR